MVNKDDIFGVDYTGISVRLQEYQDEQGNTRYKVASQGQEVLSILKEISGNWRAVRSFANDHGVLLVQQFPEGTSEGKKSTIRRCEFVFEIARRLGTQPKKDFDSTGALDSVAGPKAYYRDAVESVIDNKHFTDLYTWQDIEQPITWGELAYLSRYVFGLPANIDPRTIKLSKDDRVGYLKVRDEATGVERGTLVLSHYTTRGQLDNYIEDIRAGKKYIPAPLFFSWVDFLSHDWVEGLDKGDILVEVPRDIVGSILDKITDAIKGGD